MIYLGNFKIINFDKNNSKHMEVYNDLVQGDSKSNMISLIGERLLLSRKTTTLEYGNAYLIERDEQILGYMYISANPTNYIYFELSLLKKYRKNGIGSQILDEMTNYIFSNDDDIKEIRLSIDKSNIGSMKSAMNVGYFYDEDDYMNEKIDFIKENPYYQNKKR